jgi:hypothetical protein
MITCPNCQHTWTPAKRTPKATSVTAVDLSTLSDAQLYAYHKANAPRADIAFVQAHGLPDYPMPDKPTKRDALCAFDAWRASRPYLAAPDEGRFWFTGKYVSRRIRANEYRERCQHTRTVIRQAEVPGGYDPGPDDAAQATIKLLRAARALVPHAPMFTSGAV